MNIGLSIKKIRSDKGISQIDLASKCKISQTSLSQIENGIKRPSQKTLKKICTNIGVPEAVLYLYGLEKADIPKNKKELFEVLFPTVKDLIEKLIIE